jgi:hypothetical protein
MAAVRTKFFNAFDADAAMAVRVHPPLGSKVQKLKMAVTLQ